MSDGIKLTIKQVPPPPQHTWVHNPKYLVYLDPKQQWSISGTRETQFSTRKMKLVIKQGDTQVCLSGETEYPDGYVATVHTTPYKEMQCPVAFRVTATHTSKDGHNRQVNFIVGASHDGGWFFSVI